MTFRALLRPPQLFPLQTPVQERGTINSIYGSQMRAGPVLAAAGNAPVCSSLPTLAHF